MDLILYTFSSRAFNCPLFWARLIGNFIYTITNLFDILIILNFKLDDLRSFLFLPKFTTIHLLNYEVLLFLVNL
jgi:hypothetical protein